MAKKKKKKRAKNRKSSQPAQVKKQSGSSAGKTYKKPAVQKAQAGKEKDNTAPPVKKKPAQNMPAKNQQKGTQDAKTTPRNAAKAGAGVPSAREKSKPPGLPKRGKKAGARLCALLLLVVVCGMAANGLLLAQKTEDIATSQAESLPSEPVIENSEEKEEAPAPAEKELGKPPLSEEEKAFFTFTQEERLELNTLLNNWSAVREAGESTGHNVAVYFKDIDSGAEYIYNAKHKFFIASLNKAPYALYLYNLAEKGAANLDAGIYVTYGHVSSSLQNSGYLKNDPTLPREITGNGLIYYLLRYSDTAALRILMSEYSAAGYAAYARETFGLHYPDDVADLENGRICALDAGVYLHHIYNYMEAGQYGEDFKLHLTNTRNPMIRSQYPVARKYGWDVGAFHDMAVVYAPHPYLIAILTDKDAGSASEYAMFSLVSKTFERMMQEKWDAYNLQMAE